MALVDLASQSNGRPVALADIAERQDISLSYLEQLFAKLRRGGLVTSVRGPVAATGSLVLPASCALPTSSWQWTNPSPPRAAKPAAPRAAPKRARVASPMTCGR